MCASSRRPRICNSSSLGSNTGTRKSKRDHVLSGETCRQVSVLPPKKYSELPSTGFLSDRPSHPHHGSWSSESAVTGEERRQRGQDGGGAGGRSQEKRRRLDRPSLSPLSPDVLECGQGADAARPLGEQAPEGDGHHQGVPAAEGLRGCWCSDSCRRPCQEGEGCRRCRCRSRCRCSWWHRQEEEGRGDGGRRYRSLSRRGGARQAEGQAGEGREGGGRGGGRGGSCGV